MLEATLLCCALTTGYFAAAGLLGGLAALVVEAIILRATER